MCSTFANWGPFSLCIFYMPSKRFLEIYPKEDVPLGLESRGARENLQDASPRLMKTLFLHSKPCSQFTVFVVHIHSFTVFFHFQFTVSVRSYFTVSQLFTVFHSFWFSIFTPNFAQFTVHSTLVTPLMNRAIYFFIPPTQPHVWDAYWIILLKTRPLEVD